MSTLSLKKDTPATPAAAPAAVKVQQVYVRTVQGRMHHLFNDTVFTEVPQKVDKDPFVTVNAEAGKLLIVEP
jgi:hypothetical protein